MQSEQWGLKVRKPPMETTYQLMMLKLAGPFVPLVKGQISYFVEPLCVVYRPFSIPNTSVTFMNSLLAHQCIVKHSIINIYVQVMAF